MNSLTVPTFLRKPFYKAYSKAFGCNLDEMAEPDLEAYPNLGEFFYRKLKDGVRPIDPKAAMASFPSDFAVSSADGKVLNFGVVKDRRVEQIKGMTYSLDALLGKDEVKYTGSTAAAATVPAVIPAEADPAARSSPSGKGKELHFCVIYLAPGDYHRFHSPVDWTVYTFRHFAGELLSVSPWVVAKIKNLFVLNERVSLTGKWEHGFFAMIPVGATNVGSIKIDMVPDLATNLPEDSPKFHPLGTFTELNFGSKGRRIHRGDEMGGFRLGSTVVVVFEAPKDRFKFLVKEGEKVKVGQPIGVVEA
ncbi:phosphatidylserine decarboxylase 1 [Phlyctochytrium bullatum]|nr:phosphatidylserine decarboxylase 1 [Phlyctochytrium bullatum]